MIGFLGIGKHHRVRGLLSAYIDGQVSETESRRVEKHLVLCDECRLELGTLRSTVDLLNRLPDLAVPRSRRLFASIRVGRSSVRARRGRRAGDAGGRRRPRAR